MMETCFPPPKDEWAFEEFCLRLLKVYWPESEPQRYAARGQSQQGVDIIDMTGREPLRAAQCKHKESGKVLTPAEVCGDIKKATSFEPRIGEYYILTSSKRSAKLQKAILELNQEHQGRGLYAIILHTWEMIEEILQAHPDLYEGITAPPLKGAIQPLEQKMDALGHRVDILVAREVNDKYDAKLESARSLLQEHSRQEAKLTLRQLRTGHWSDLSESQRFLTLTYLAQVEYAEDHWTEAGQLFLEAKEYQPADERARINEALAYELLEQREKAHGMAKELAATFPKACRPWALICRTAPDGVEARNLEAELPDHAKADQEVLVALATRAIRQEDWSNAERLAQKALECGTEWPAPWLLLAQAKLQKAIDVGYKLADGSLVPITPPVVKEIIHALDRAVKLSEDSRSVFFLGNALFERARAKRLAGDVAGADDDCARACRESPGDPDTLLQYGKHLYQRGKAELAILTLRDAIARGAGAEAKSMLAVALHEHDATTSRSEWVALAREAAKDVTSFSQWETIGLALEGFFDEKRLSEAEQFLDGLAANGLPEIAADSYRVRVALAQNDRGSASSRASAALGRLTDATPHGLVRLVADAYSRLGDQTTAAPLWERVVTATKIIIDAWRAVSAAKQAKQYDVVRRICRQWREAGVSDARLLHDELEILERFAPNEALGLLEREVKQRPEDSLLRLRLSSLALQLDRPELVCRDPASYPKPENVGARNGAVVVRVLQRVEAFEAALRYSYSLLRHNQDDPIADLTFAFTVISGDPEDVLASPEVVEVGAAVCFVEQGTGEERWRVIEDDPHGPRFPEDIPPDHELAVRLKGLRSNDSFLIAGHEPDGRKATVREILSKYAYRARRCMSDWQIRFPGQPGFEMFRISPAAGPAGIPDFTPIVRRTYDRKRGIDELLKVYRQQPVPISMLATAAGVHMADTVIHLATSETDAVHCCTDNPGEFEGAAAAAATASAIVLDSSAAVALLLLDLDDRLATWPASFIVSSQTAAELRGFRESHREMSSGWVLPTDTGLGITFVEIPEAEHRKQHDRINAFVDHVLTASEIRDCGELADLPPKDREEMIECFGQYGAESVLLARSPGYVLWTDDFVMAAYSQEKFGIRRVWTQAMLARLVSDGFVSSNEYGKASARLIGFNYVATRYDALTLRAATVIADWRPNERPLKQALQIFAQPRDPKVAIAIAAQFVQSIFSEAIALPSHREVVMAVLAGIGDGPLGTAGVSALRKAITYLFGLNVSAAKEVDECFRRWFSIRGIDS